MGKRLWEGRPQEEDPLRGLQEYLKAHQNVSVLEQEAGKGTSWCFFLHGDQVRIGTIQSNQTYEFDLMSQEGVVEKIHKVKLKFLSKASVKEEVIKRLGRYNTLGGASEGPHFSPRYRHHIKNKTLYPLMNRKEVLFFKMVEGEVLRGVVTGFSRFEISLSMKGGVPLVLLRHAVLDLRDKKGRCYLKKAVEKSGQYW